MQRKSVHIEEYTISYLEAGKGDPLLFLHAFPFNALMWTAQLQSLSRHFHVIALDFPSFGASSPTPNVLTMDLAALITENLLNHLDIKQTALAGLSMGGYIALACAEHMPQRISTLILADTHARADTSQKQQQRHKMVLELQQQGSDSLIQQFPLTILGKTTLQQRKNIIQQVQEIMKMASTDTIISAIKGMAMRPNRLAILQQFTKPVSIIVGEEDTLTPLADAQEMAKVTPQATLHIIPKGGHLSNMEQPALFSNIIQTILIKK